MVPPFIDAGQAPEYFASGLYDVNVMPHGICRFVLYIERTLSDGSKIWEPPCTVIMPSGAIGAGIALTMQKLGLGPEIRFPGFVTQFDPREAH